mmetsp:Transcript_31371/g.108457  ORF Transcript_31371/g.108457 Transcript_31371/m.108457 type:complete len:478 (+) Transcript_31371:1340-2773(+)
MTSTFGASSHGDAEKTLLLRTSANACGSRSKAAMALCAAANRGSFCASRGTPHDLMYRPTISSASGKAARTRTFLPCKVLKRAPTALSLGDAASSENRSAVSLAALGATTILRKFTRASAAPATFVNVDGVARVDRERAHPAAYSRRCRSVATQRTRNDPPSWPSGNDKAASAGGCAATAAIRSTPGAAFEASPMRTMPQARACSKTCAAPRRVGAWARAHAAVAPASTPKSHCASLAQPSGSRESGVAATIMRFAAMLEASRASLRSDAAWSSSPTRTSRTTTAHATVRPDRETASSIVSSVSSSVDGSTTTTCASPAPAFDKDSFQRTSAAAERTTTSCGFSSLASASAAAAVSRRGRRPTTAPPPKADTTATTRAAAAQASAVECFWAATRADLSTLQGSTPRHSTAGASASAIAASPDLSTTARLSPRPTSARAALRSRSAATQASAKSFAAACFHLRSSCMSAASQAISSCR